MFMYQQTQVKNSQSHADLTQNLKLNILKMEVFFTTFSEN